MTEPVVISQLPIKQAQKPPKETNGYKNIFHYSTYGSVIAARTEGGGNTGQLSPQKKKKKLSLLCYNNKPHFISRLSFQKDAQSI
jgi:hypothetical protein